MEIIVNKGVGTIVSKGFYFKKREIYWIQSKRLYKGATNSVVPEFK